MTAIVAGAGIAGLVTALALARAGHPVTVVERRTGFSEAGAGLQLSPNASRILIDLGLGPALRRAASAPERLVVRALRSGRVIGGAVLGAFMEERFGAPYLVAHRADLQTLLLDAVRGRSGIRLLMGREAVRAEGAGDHATLTVARNGASETLSADLVAGADGLWSSLRRSLPDARAPRYRGTTAWRTTLPASTLPHDLDPAEVGLWLGRDRHVVHYWLPGGRLNVVAVERRRHPVEGWSSPGDPAEIRIRFADAAPRLGDLVGAAPEWRLWSLYDLPARRMAAGRIALLGDAAHPVLPYLAQGAALAIEDAAALAAALQGGAVPDALRRFEQARLPRARKVQQAARRNGTVYHAGPALSLARDLVMRRLGPAGMTARYDWLYGA